jgi:hypothetical protein
VSVARAVDCKVGGRDCRRRRRRRRRRRGKRRRKIYEY